EMSRLRQHAHRPQIIARLVETTAAEGEDELASRRDDVVGQNVVLLPTEAQLIETEVRRVLILDDRANGLFVQAQHMSQNAGAEDVEEAVHLRPDAAVEVAQRMVQTRSAFEYQVIVATGRDDVSDLRRLGKR